MQVDLRVQDKTYTFADTSEGQYFICRGRLYLCCSPYDNDNLRGCPDEYAYCFNTEEFVHFNFDEPITPILDTERISIKVVG